MLTNITLLFLSFIIGLCFVIFLKKIPFPPRPLKKEKRVPPLGGIGFCLAFIISYASYLLINNITIPFQLLWLLIFSLIILMVEIIDDLKEFSLKVRIIIQLIIIFIFLLWGKRVQIYFLPYWFNYIISFLWIMGITNAFNLLDVGDGLCGGVSIVISLSFFLISLLFDNLLMASLFITLLGGLCAFYLFNLPPAKIFMGNSGSHFLGFLFATLSIYGDYATLDNPLALIVPLLILAFPVMDTAYLIFARINKKILPLKKSNDHIFLRLILKGYSYRKAINIIYLVTMIWCLSGLAVIYGFNYLFLSLIILASLASSFVIVEANRAKTV
jgi:UDP-GlcNAc:undecaprenyl-phosphate GlcNAc-1-phosphate transferase